MTFKHSFCYFFQYQKHSDWRRVWVNYVNDVLQYSNVIWTPKCQWAWDSIILVINNKWRCRSHENQDICLLFCLRLNVGVPHDHDCFATLDELSCYQPIYGSLRALGGSVLGPSFPSSREYTLDGEQAIYSLGLCFSGVSLQPWSQSCEPLFGSF